MVRKNHVGRPSNEELKRRRNKKILLIGAPIALVGILAVLISTGGISKLMGNSVTEYYCEDSTYNLDGTDCVKTITKKAALLGDINSDEKVDNTDLNVLNNYVKDEKSVNLSELQLKAADINSDGMISELDVQILEGFFSKVAATYAELSEKIGVERLCEDDYTLNGKYCYVVETIPAIKKEMKTIQENTNNTNNNVNSDKSNDNTNDVNNTNNNTEQKVLVSLKPEDNTTNLKVNRKYNINVVFDIKDNSQTYYYIWRNYLYGENNYSTECKKVVQGEHGGNFEAIGTRKVNVTVYSDSSCKNKVTSVDSKKYTCDGCTNMVDVKLKPQDNKTSFTKGTKYKMNVLFNIKDKENTYYYIWYNFLNGTNNYKTGCQKVTQGEHGGSFTIDGTKAVQVFVYSDSSCKNEIKHVTSKKYTCTNCTPLTISIGKNLSSSQIKGTVVHNGVIFNVNDKTNTYYYIWRTYTNGSNTYTSDCQKVTSGKEYVKDLTINGTRKGTITVYSDNKCTKRLNTVPVAETTTYTCSNCNVQSSYSGSSSSGKTSGGNTTGGKTTGSNKKKVTCTCPSGSKPIGGECFKPSTKYNIHVSKVCKWTCPNGKKEYGVSTGRGMKYGCASSNPKTQADLSNKIQVCNCPSGAKSIGGECFKPSTVYNIHVNKVCK